MSEAHRGRIRDQFTKQAVPFSTAPAMRDEEILARLVTFASPAADARVLDVACGPGLVVNAFAPAVRRASGVDVTPAMLARAAQLAAERGNTNVDWAVADVAHLPYRDGSFDVVTSRFAFHHLLDPVAVLREMRRVCRPGGAVVLVDLTASDDPAEAAAFHRMEMLRDPSHARALTFAELQALFPSAGLPDPAVEWFEHKVDLDGVMARSFPDPQDVPTIRRMFEESLADDGMGLGTYEKNGSIRFRYRCAMLRAER
jgi:SAM-dependent methyltransferase